MSRNSAASKRLCTHTWARNGRLLTLVGTIGVLGLAFTSMAEAQPPEPASHMARSPCRDWTEPDWTTSEHWVWSQGCDGGLADLQELPKDNRTLRAIFLETVLLRAPYRDALRPRGLHVHGAVITGRLDLSNARLEFPLYLEHSRFEDAVSLRDLRSSSFVELAHSRFEADVDMQRVRIDQGLLSEDAEFAGLDLYGAEIDGQLVLNGASFSSLLDLESARIARDVLMRETHLETLNLVSARIEGALLMVGAEASGRVDADSLDLKQSLFLGEAKLSELNLSTARIEGKILAGGLDVRRGLDADSIMTAAWVDLSEASAASLNLSSSSIGSWLSLLDAEVMGAITLNNLKASGLVNLRGARAASVSLSSGSIGALISLSNARVTGAVKLDSLKTSGSAFFSRATLDSVDLDFAEIAGRADFSGARIEKAVGLFGATVARGLVFGDGSRIGGETNLERARIQGNLILRGHEQVGDLHFRGTQIGGQIAIEHSHFGKGLDLDSTTIGESLFLRDLGRPLAALALRGVEIGGQLDIRDQHILQRLDLHEVRVADSLYLRSVIGPHLVRTDGSCETQSHGGREASIHDTDIGGDLDLSGSRLSCLDLSGSTIGGSLLLYSRERGPVRWQSASWLGLRDSRVGTVADDGDLGNPPAYHDLAGFRSTWPAHLDVAGFRFTRFARLPGRAEVAAGERSAEWYRAWLARSAYSSQSYQHLAEYLRRDGRIEDANNVLFAGRERYRTEHASGLEWVELTLLKAIIGYGYGHKIFYSLIWVLVFVALGVAVLWENGEGRRRGLAWAVVYSFDRLLPIIRLDERNYEVQLHGAAQYYMYLHMLVGYVLASFVVAGLAGLTD